MKTVGEKERDFEAGDKILIEGHRLAIVTCTHSTIDPAMGRRVHGMDYKSTDGSGWAHPSICRKITDEEWSARILMDGKG